MSYLYILEIKPLLVTSFASIFSHSIGCLFVLLMVSFAVQKTLSLIRPHLFIFAFISFALGDRSKKILLLLMSKSAYVLFFQISQHYLLKRLSFLHCIFLPPLSCIDYRCVALFLGSLFCSIDLFVCFCANTMLF